MLVIQSYLKHPKRLIKNFEKVKKDPFYYFIEINNSIEIFNIKKDLDLYYIEGVIHLTYNNQVIMDFTYYDLIDHLWAYFLNMIEEFLQTRKSSMSFPDQPLPMSMENISDNEILFSINYIQWKLPKNEFFSALLSGAKDFFEKMILLLEEDKDSHLFQLQKVKKLELKINNLP